MRTVTRWGVLAMVVPVLFSAATWVCVWGLIGGWFYLLLAVGVVAVRFWDSPRALRLRHRVRPAADHEAAAVLEALVPAAGLRGRRQPRVWILRQPSKQERVVAITPADVAVPEPMVVGLLHRSLDVDEFCAATVWAIGVRTSRGHSVRHTALEVLCLPASVVSAVIRPARQLTAWPLVRTCWALRGGLAVIGLVQSASTDHAWAGVGSMIVVALSYAHPWWARRRDAQLVQAGDDEVARAGLATVWVRMLRRRGGTLDVEARIARLESSTRDCRVRASQEGRRS